VSETRLISTCLLLAAALAAPLRAQDRPFEEGNKRYQAGDYAGALEQYQQIVSQGYEAPALYYNIGNAQYKLGHLGAAIVAWERARRLAPRDADVLANLELARSLTADDITPRPQFWLFAAVSWWVGLLSRSALLIIAGTAYALTTACVVALVTRSAGGWTPWARRVALTGAIVTILSAINLLVRELGIGRADAAIVMAKEVMVQSAPSDEPSLQIFTIHEGTKVRVDRTSASWSEIALADGKVGWVKTDALERI
jgi:tetratricopeptide (TPR) repeat protein